MRAVLRGETATEHKKNLISEIRLSTLDFGQRSYINIVVAPNIVV